MDSRGIEPRYFACKANVIPLYHKPVFCQVATCKQFLQVQAASYGIEPYTHIAERPGSSRFSTIALLAKIGYIRVERMFQSYQLRVLTLVRIT